MNAYYESYGFEDGGAGSLFTGDAEVNTDAARSGDSGLQIGVDVQVIWTLPPTYDITDGQWLWTVEGLTVGERYVVRAWAKHIEIGNLPIDLAIRNPATAATATLDTLDTSATDWTQMSGEFVASGESAQVQLRCDESGVSITKWYADDVEVVGMAIQLAERGVDAVVSTLQSNLSAELAAIVSEMGDGVTLTAPANADYYKRPKSEISGGTAHVEVFEQEFDIEQPYTDAAAGRLAYELPLIVRLTAINRDAATADTMMKRMRRYGAGIVRVLVENYQLGGTDDSLKIVRPVTYRPYWEVDSEDEDMVNKVRVEVPLLVLCEEVNT